MNSDRWNISLEEYEHGRQVFCLDDESSRETIEQAYEEIKQSITVHSFTYEYRLDSTLEADSEGILLLDCYAAKPENYNFNVYKMDFCFPENEWHPLEWATTYRAILKMGIPMKPGNIKLQGGKAVHFEDQMKHDIQGLLGELFVAACFGCDFDKFWEDFCKYAGEGDQGNDLEIGLHRLNIKTRVIKPTGGTVNIGTQSTPLLFPLVDVAWNDRKLKLNFWAIIDSNPFWEWEANCPIQNLRVTTGDYDSKFIRLPFLQDETTGLKENELVHDDSNFASLDFQPNYPDLIAKCGVLPLAPKGANEKEYEEICIERGDYE